MPHTTLNLIRAQSPAPEGWWSRLLRRLGKDAADAEPLSLLTILDVAGQAMAMWTLDWAVPGYDREKRLLAIAIARDVQPAVADPRAGIALEVADRHARGEASDEELAAAAAAARQAYVDDRDLDQRAAAAYAAAAIAAGPCPTILATADAADAASFAAGGYCCAVHIRRIFGAPRQNAHNTEPDLGEDALRAATVPIGAPMRPHRAPG